MLVAFDERKLCGQVDLYLLVSQGKQRADQRQGIVDDFAQLDALVTDAELSRLDPHALEQIVDQAGEPQGAALERPDELLLLLGTHRRHPFKQQLDRGELGCQRRPELVRDVCEHGIACTAYAFQFRLVPYDLHLQTFDHARAGDDRYARLGF